MCLNVLFYEAAVKFVGIRIHMQWGVIERRRVKLFDIVCCNVTANFDNSCVLCTIVHIHYIRDYYVNLR